MDLVTDRTQEDVLLRREKGSYSCADLNRVEGTVQKLATLMLEEMGIDLDLDIKTDWGLPGDFSANSWPTEDQMNRYLMNVVAVCDELDLQVDIPLTMRGLTIEGANNVEKALEQAYEEIQRRLS